MSNGCKDCFPPWLGLEELYGVKKMFDCQRTRGFYLKIKEQLAWFKKAPRQWYKSLILLWDNKDLRNLLLIVVFLCRNITSCANKLLVFKKNPCPSNHFLPLWPANRWWFFNSLLFYKIKFVYFLTNMHFLLFCYMRYI